MGKVDRGTEALTCRELVELVTEYLEATLWPEDRARFDEHIAECGDCTAHLDQMRRTLGLVGRLTEGSVSPQAREALLGTFRDWRE
ncbi:MAG TPA: zf-HC2 domain-containing protein [Actinomycetota bacterium]|nr:zf-HC2 domain-containing protein [Actinomycetota bacterium]